MRRRRVTRGRSERRGRSGGGASADQEAPGAPWLLDDVSPSALAMALADWDADELVGPIFAPAPWEGA